MSDPVDHLDVLIVGAGLSGIGAAWRLQQRLPGRTCAIVEQRDAIGGTWDLFRYPGVPVVPRTITPINGRSSAKRAENLGRPA